MREMDRLFFQLYSSLPEHQTRVHHARALVIEALSQMKQPYIALSSGKDSSCVAHLVWSIDASVPGVYFDADCAFPESLELLERLSEHYSLIKWKCEPLLDTFARYGGPTAKGVEQATMESTVYTPVRALLETYQFDGVFLGLRSQESEGRAKTRKFHGTLYRYKRDNVLRCLPVADWNFSDVWAYIVANDIDYNRAYDKMWSLPERERRISYWAGETQRRGGRWVFLKQEYPELFNRFAARFPDVREYI